MRSVIMVLLGVALCFGGRFANAEDVEKRALAEELLNQMQMKETMEKSFAMMKKMIPQFAKMAGKSFEKDEAADDAETVERRNAAQMGAELGAEMSEKMFDEMAKEMSWDSMKDDFISIYAETYTKEELGGLIKFYKSPVGRAFIKKQPELMKRSMQLSQKRVAKLMPKIQAMTEEMMEAMKAKHAEKATPPAPAAATD